MDGHLDELWKAAYAKLHEGDRGNIKNFIYARKSLAKNLMTFSKYRAEQLIDDILQKD
jgi:hypothetical protein